MGCDAQYVIRALNGDIEAGNAWKSGAEGVPGGAAVAGVIDADIGSSKYGIGVATVNYDGVNGNVRDAAARGTPGRRAAVEVGGLPHVLHRLRHPRWLWPAGGGAPVGAHPPPTPPPPPEWPPPRHPPPAPL